MNDYDMPIYWEYEDKMPNVRPSQFDLLFPLSRIIDGVRMYPYIRDENGNKVYIGQAVSE